MVSKETYGLKRDLWSQKRLVVSNRRALHAHVWMQIWIHYIIYDNNAVGTPVVSISDCPKSLMTGSVPYLQGK